MMQIYYINLARRTDRRAFMEEQFARLGLTATRIEAVTPADLTDAQRDRPIDPSTGTTLPEPALCCSYSHLSAFRALLHTAAPWALVLEDDAVLSSRLPAFLAAFERAPPVARANLTLARATGDFAGVTLHRFRGWDIGSAAYLISRAGAQTVLESGETRRRDIDTAMFHDIVSLSRRLRPLQSNPGLCIQAGSLPDSVGAHVMSDLLASRVPPSFSWRRVARVLERDLVEASRKAWQRFVLGGKRMRVPFKSD